MIWDLGLVQMMRQDLGQELSGLYLGQIWAPLAMPTVKPTSGARISMQMMVFQQKTAALYWHPR